jgi:hypothetical protein
LLEPILYIFGIASAWFLFAALKLPFVIYGVVRPRLPSDATKRTEERIVLAGFIFTALIWAAFCYGIIALFEYMHI